MKKAELCPSQLGSLRDSSVFFDFRGIDTYVYTKLRISRIYVVSPLIL